FDLWPSDCPGGTTEISWWWSERSEREPPDRIGKSIAPRRGRRRCCVAPFPPPLRDEFCCGTCSGGFAWLHHRLISVTLPASKQPWAGSRFRAGSRTMRFMSRLAGRFGFRLRIGRQDFHRHHSVTRADLDGAVRFSGRGNAQTREFARFEVC